jgi:hypothetical protein
VRGEKKRTENIKKRQLDAQKSRSRESQELSVFHMEKTGLKY